MLLSEMITLLNTNIDDVVDASTATRWLNAGQNQMAAEARAEFTQLVATNQSSTFDFPAKYHEIPVLYACAMYQSSESSIGEKNSYLIQFQEGLKTFLETYDVPMQYRDDSNTQQFVKSSTDNNTYTITKRGYSLQSNLKVYVNSVQTTTFTTLNNTFTITYETEPAAGAKITATWEDRPDLQEPPYSWWKAW